MKPASVFVLAVCILLLFSIGCHKDNSTQSPGTGGLDLRIVMPRDSLVFLAGDHASIQGSIELTENGQPKSGVRLELEARGGFGYIDFVNGNDTTDGLGKVDFELTVQDVITLSSDTIRAAYGSAQDIFVLRLIPISPGFLTITAEPDTVHRRAQFPPLDSTVVITLSLQDSAHHPISGAHLALSSSLGQLGIFPPTNQQGISQGIFIPVQLGRSFVAACVANLCDTAWVVVDSLPTTMGSIRIVLPVDTLHCFYGDSAFTDGYIEVRDQGDHPWPGVKASATLLQSFGFLEFLNPNLRDTTDALGRVGIRFGVYNTEYAGTVRQNTIRAGCPRIGLFENRQVWVSYDGVPIGNLDVAVSRSHIEAHGIVNDSVYVTVTVTDTNSVGIPDTQVPVTTNGGFLRTLPPTDASGRAGAYWSFTGYGTYTVTAQIGEKSDSASVLVDSARHQTVTNLNIIMRDTLYVTHGDSAWATGYVLVRDESGMTVPGEQVDLWLSQAVGYLEFLDTDLRDTTDANGRVNFMFRVINDIGAGYQVINAECYGIPANHTLWLVWRQGPPGAVIRRR